MNRLILKYFFAFLSFGIVHMVQAQETRQEKLGRLKFQLLEAKSVEDSLIIISDLAGIYYQYNLDSAESYNRLSQELSEKVPGHERTGHIYLLSEEIAQFRGTFDERLDALEKASSAFLLNNQIEDLIHSICKEGILLFEMKMPEKAALTLERALNLARENSLYNLEGYVYFILGKHDFHYGEYAKAESNFNTSLELHKKGGHKNPAALYSEMGNMYYHQGLYHKAYRMYKEGLVFAEENDDHHGLSYLLNNIGMMEHRLGQYQRAMETLGKCMEHRKKVNYGKGIATTLATVADVYISTGKYDSALAKCHEAIRITSARDMKVRARVFHTLANIYMQNSVYDSAKYNFEMSVNSYEEMNSTYFLSETYLDFSELALKTDDSDLFFKCTQRAEFLGKSLENKVLISKAKFQKGKWLLQNGRLSEALQKMDSLLLEFDRSEAPELYIEVSNKQANIYQSIGGYDMAYSILEDQKKFSDSIQSSAFNQRLVSIVANNLLDFKKNEVELLRVRNLNLFYTIAILVLLLALAGFVTVYIRKKLSLEKKLLAVTQEDLRLKKQNEQLLLEKIDLEEENKRTQLKGMSDIIESKNRFMVKLKEMITENYHENPGSLRKDIDKVLKSIRDQLSQHNKSFEVQLVSQEEEFLNSLKDKYPNLTSKEIRMCLYIKMNFSNKEIADFSHVLQSTVEKSKFRLKHKLELEADQNLNDFILQL